MSTPITTNDPFEDYYFQHEPEIICDKVVPALTEGYTEDYPSVVDRFFERYYYIKPSNGLESYKVLFHSNRICLICLAPEHEALKSNITSINFDVGNADRSKNTVSGKGKKGGMPLQSDSTLCLITTSENKVYKVPSCIRGKLIEVNTALAEHPEFLQTAPEGEAYIAIVLPKPEHCKELKSVLLNAQQYSDYLTSQAGVQSS